MRSQPHLPPFDKSGVCAAAIGRVSEASWLQPACAPDLWWLDKQSEAVSEGAPRRAGGGATSATMGPWAMGWSGALFLNAPPLTPPLCTTIEDGRRGHRGGRGGGCARPTSPGSGTPPPRTAPPGLQCVHSHAFSSPPSPGDCAPASSPLQPHPHHLLPAPPSSTCRLHRAQRPDRQPSTPLATFATTGSCSIIHHHRSACPKGRYS